MIELSNSKKTYLGKAIDGRDRWALDASIGATQFREDGGDWQDIDPSVEAPDTDGFSVKFTQVPYLGRIGEDSRRRIYPDRTNLDCWIEFQKPFPNMPKPSRHDRWFYWDFPNALMGIRFDNTSIKFGFRLKNTNAPTSITIPFETQGIKRQGRVLYHDGNVIAELCKPGAIDANEEERECEVSFGTGEVTISLDTTGLTFPIDIDPTLDIRVGASYDDVLRRLTTSYWSRTATSERAGYSTDSAYEYGSGMRFINIAIPQGVLIDEAHVKFRADQTRSGVTCRTRLSAEDVDDAPTFADSAGVFDTRYSQRTSAKVNWDSIPTWTMNNDYNSPDIKTVIKEIVDRGGWGSGNAIVIFWEDFDDRSSHSPLAHRRALSYNGSSSYCPELHIEWTAVADHRRAAFLQMF